MLYKIDKQSKINFINLVNSFMLLDENKTDEEKKLLANLEKSLLGNENDTRIQYCKKEDIKKSFDELPPVYRNYLKDILLEINEKNYYKDGFFNSSIKQYWKNWLKTELK